MNVCRGTTILFTSLGIDKVARHIGILSRALALTPTYLRISDNLHTSRTGLAWGRLRLSTRLARMREKVGPRQQGTAYWHFLFDLIELENRKKKSMRYICRLQPP